MVLGESRGILRNLWLTNEEVTAIELENSESVNYENMTDLIAILSTQETASGSSASRVLGGLQVEWSSGLNIYLRAGAAVSYQGYYLQNGTWSFTALAGAIFSVFVGQDQLIAVSAPASLQRIDILEIMPVQTNYNFKPVNFIDPVTKVVTSSSVNTRQSFDFAWQWKLGTPGVATAPTADSGWIKVAEVTVPASAGAIAQSNILDARDSDLWTTAPSSTMYKEQRAGTTIVEDRGNYFSTVSYKSVENILQYIMQTLNTYGSVTNTPNTAVKRDASGNIFVQGGTFSGTIQANGSLILPTQTSDPASPAVGQIWFRSDL